MPVFPLSLSQWKYRRAITINNTSNSNNLTDYQVLITLDTQSLISAGKMRSDCGDIRFINSDGQTLLNYWLESGCNTASTKIWVKVPSIPASSTKTIYVYYGNPSATSLSNGTATFDFFDDFEDGNYDGWTWNRFESDDTLSLETTNPIDGSYSLREDQGYQWGYVRAYSPFINGINLAFKVKAKQTGYTYMDNGSGMGFGIMFYDNSNTLLKTLLWIVYTTTVPENNAVWHEYAPSIQRVDNWNLPNDQIGERELILANYAPTSATKIRIKAQIQNVDYGTFWTDLYRVRKYTSPEPTTSVGTEEKRSSIIPLIFIR
jgi:hypothetical protein